MEGYKWISLFTFVVNTASRKYEAVVVIERTNFTKEEKESLWKRYIEANAAFYNMLYNHSMIKLGAKELRTQKEMEE